MDIRLQKVLAQAGISSRRKAEELITEGRVEVNGAIQRELGTRVDPSRDLIRVDGKLIESEQKVYYLLYKPLETVTTLSDPQGRRTIRDCMAGVEERVFAVGRLDYDAEGALILTNDGELANRLMHPRYNVPRTYLAKVKGEPDEATVEKLRSGVTLEDGPAKPDAVEIEKRAEKNTWLRIVVSEGRPHLVKRLCAAIGHPVVRLYRPSYAGLSVEGLAPGGYRPLTREEVEALRHAGKESESPTSAPFKLPPRRHRAAEEGAAGASRPKARAERKTTGYLSEDESAERPATSDEAPRERRGGGERPFASRGEGERGERPFRSGGFRGQGAGRPFAKRGPGGPGGERSFGKRGFAGEGGERRPYGKRSPAAEGGGERRSFGKRSFAGEGGEGRPFGKRGPAGEGGGRPFGKRGFAGEGGEGRPFGKRGPAGEGGGRPFGKRSFAGEGGERRPFGNRGSAGEGGGRPFAKRGPAGEGGGRPFGKRSFAGEGGGRSFGNRGPAGEGGGRPFGKRSFAGEGGGARPFGKRSFGDRPAGERGASRGRPFGKPERSGGPRGERGSFSGGTGGRPGGRGAGGPRRPGGGGFKGGRGGPRGRS